MTSRIASRKPTEVSVVGSSVLHFFDEGIVLVASGETLSDSLLPTRLSLEVTTAGKRLGTDSTPAVTTGDLATNGGDVSLGRILITERPAAPATIPLLRFVVEVGLGLTTGFEACLAFRRKGRR